MIALDYFRYTLRDELKHVVAVLLLPFDGKGSSGWSRLSASPRSAQSALDD